MVNRAKVKGTAWENLVVDLLNKHLDKATFKRIPGSGAIGTIMGEGLLTGDISGKIAGFPKKIRGEAKVGYGGSKQLTVKKEWIDKIHEEAANTQSLPALFCKFSDARSGVKHFVVLSLEDFIEIMNYITMINGEEDD